MDKKKAKRIRRYVSWVLLVCVVALLAVLPMLAAKEETTDGPQASILSDTAALRDISTGAMGGGTLTAEEAVEVTIPSAVKVTEFLVENGDLLVEGQPIAQVDRVSVMTAITQVQETLESLREQIDDVSGETAAQTVTATAGGTVKAVYAEEGEAVQDVMLRDGALAVLSLDGLMAVQVERRTDLSGGDRVCVELSDGREAEGQVESNLEGILTVTVEDAGYAVGEKVTVTTEEGDRIGSGSLYIHSQWNVVAYSGVISRVRISEGDSAAAGSTLFNLKDTGYTAEFGALTRQHREYEALMLELFRMYQSGTVTAPCDGMVAGMDENGAYMLAGSGTGWTVSLLANAPNGDDEASYINYIGQVSEVGIDGLVLKMNPQPFFVTDYKDLSAVSLDTALMTEDVICALQVPVYELSGEEWVQIDGSAITAGDLLLFAGDAAGNFVWVVRVAGGTPAPEEPEEPTAPTEPQQPEAPTEPEDPSDPQNPEEPSDEETSSPAGSGERPQSGGSMQGMGGSAAQEETDDLYTLDTVSIASVTPQDTMTVQITVDELDISRIYLGQEAALTMDALPGEKFTGSVTSVSSSGENEGGNSKFTVEVTLDREGDMLPGMTASVSITVQTEKNVLCVPVAALTENGAQTIVYTGFDEETETLHSPAVVTVGTSDGEYARILSGISEGQTVYYPYYDTLFISDVPDAGGGFPFG